MIVLEGVSFLELERGDFCKFMMGSVYIDTKEFFSDYKTFIPFVVKLLTCIDKTTSIHVYYMFFRLR